MSVHKAENRLHLAKAAPSTTIRGVFGGVSVATTNMPDSTKVVLDFADAAGYEAFAASAPAAPFAPVLSMAA